jgi:uncharacterized protein (DUF58 family)
VSWIDAVEVLTASGSSVAWTGALAVVGSVSIGWASLSLMGLFGLCALHAAALWTLLRAGGADPWRRASLSRRFVPASATEGDPITEELRFTEPRIPAGFRLFASGRVAPHWPTSRYVVEAADSGGEVTLQSHVGPAHRGVHEGEPLEVWLQDVLGLCHSPRIRAGEARLTVLPATARVDGAVHLLGAGGHETEPHAARALQTEGAFRLREYQQGDDVRRIHWLRSAAARQVVVRLPDELPRGQPRVNVVLDTYHPRLASIEPLACSAPHELLDHAVRVWLGVLSALVERGVRVTAVAPVRLGDDDVAARRVLLHRRTLEQARDLGAKAQWQAVIRPADARTEGPSIVVSHRLPVDDAESAARWIVVPGAAWVHPTPRPWVASALFDEHPPGSADNRRSRRRAAKAARERERADFETFRCLSDHPSLRRAGHLLARPHGDGAARLEVLR